MTSALHVKARYCVGATMLLIGVAAANSVEPRFHRYHFPQGRTVFVFDDRDGMFGAEGEDEVLSYKECEESDRYRCVIIEMMNLFVVYPRAGFVDRKWFVNGRSYCIQEEYEASKDDIVYVVVSSDLDCEVARPDGNFVFSKKRGVLSMSSNGVSPTFVLIDESGFR